MSLVPPRVPAKYCALVLIHMNTVLSNDQGISSAIKWLKDLVDYRPTGEIPALHGWIELRTRYSSPEVLDVSIPK